MAALLRLKTYLRRNGGRKRIAISRRQGFESDSRFPASWGSRSSHANTISPEIVVTPLARDELTGPRGKGYRL
jgi:hypothetical protein